MNEDVFNMQMRKFLKRVGVTSQREIERAVRGAIVNGSIPGDRPLKVRCTVEMDALGLRHVIDDTLELE